MILNVNLSREDHRYQEIEEFEEYELTNCIGYEMAIRNDKYRNKLLEIVNEINNKYVQYKNKKYTDETIESYIKIIPNDEKLRDEKISDSFISDIRISLRELGFSEYSSDELLKIEEIKEFEIIKYLKSTYDKEKIDKRYSEVNVIVRDEYKIIQTGSHDDDDKTFILKNEVIPNFKRPFLKFRSGNHCEIMINSSVPLNELESYMKIILSDLKSNKNLLVTPDDMIGVNVDKPDKITKYTISQIKTYADDFFCYDYYIESKVSNPQLTDAVICESIANELNDYYDGSGKLSKKGDTYRRNVIPKMKYMIEESGYMELITSRRY